MRPHLPDDLLTLAAVPDPDGDWDAIVAFGHGYHAYKLAGSVQRVATQALEVHDAWETDGTLPGALPKLRLALFHTVRALHGGTPPDPDTEAWTRALVRAVHEQVRTRSSS